MVERTKEKTRIVNGVKYILVVSVQEIEEHEQTFARLYVIQSSFTMRSLGIGMAEGWSPAHAFDVLYDHLDGHDDIPSEIFDWVEQEILRVDTWQSVRSVAQGVLI